MWYRKRVPRFEPFAGIRYDPESINLAEVIAPPYDVIDAERRASLEARSPYNAVRIELPQPGDDGSDRYATCGARFEEWLASGVLIEDNKPSFYVYRMGYHDEAGQARQTAGVIGALGLEPPGGDILPHERTMPKPKDDRLNVLRSCRANLSPVWGLSLAEGLAGLCELPGPPDGRATDTEGVHHRIWRITQPGIVEAITEAVGSAPLVIADGHHRYETALVYREERRQTTGGTAGDYDLLMTYVVELADEQLTVRPIHRVIDSLPAGLDLLDVLSRSFDVFETDPATGTLPARMADAGGLALVLPTGTWLLRPHDAAAGATDSQILEAALGTVESPEGIELSYEYDAAKVVASVSKGEAVAGILLRPPTITQISAAARAGMRMPEKTTYFHPKPRTGMVFRPVRD